MVSRNELGILSQPDKPINIPKSAQWLAGQGAGSWFNISITSTNNIFTISRFSPNGTLEFKSLFNKDSKNEFNINKKYCFTYLSHYKKCYLVQNNKNICFKNANTFNKTSIE